MTIQASCAVLYQLSHQGTEHTHMYTLCGFSEVTYLYGDAGSNHTPTEYNYSRHSVIWDYIELPL